MRSLTFVGVFLYYFRYGNCLWPKGVVHYVFNQKDYDLHSQDVITSVFEAIEREVCVKFFHSPTHKTGVDNQKILYISNPEKLKNCPPHVFNYTGKVVDMPIGYKCVNTKEVTRIVVDMLRASIDQNDPISYDIMKKYNERNHDPSSTLLSPDDRNFINSHYYTECGALSARPLAVASRRDGGLEALTIQASDFYSPLVWPLGVVMYSVHPDLRGTHDHNLLKSAMSAIEASSCVVFQFHAQSDVLEPKNAVFFDYHGEETPEFGFKEGNQTLSLASMVQGAPGHNAHAINNLMRLLGVPMMSNRYDRDNYISINWKLVTPGKEYLVEKMPEEAWIMNLPYDFNSVTHAPANFACSACQLGAHTVAPIQDHLWQRTLSMGHSAALSNTDIQMLSLLYSKECQRRFN